MYIDIIDTVYDDLRGSSGNIWETIFSMYSIIYNNILYSSMCLFPGSLADLVSVNDPGPTSKASEVRTPVQGIFGIRGASRDMGPWGCPSKDESESTKDITGDSTPWGMFAHMVLGMSHGFSESPAKTSSSGLRGRGALGGAF